MKLSEKFIEKFAKPAAEEMIRNGESTREISFSGFNGLYVTTEPNISDVTYLDITFPCGEKTCSLYMGR